MISRPTSNARFFTDGEAYDKNSTSQADRASVAIASYDIKPNETIVDLGNGNGINTLKLAKLVPTGHVYGIDPSTSMQNQAKKNCANDKNITLINGDAQSFRLFNPIQRIVAFFSLQWVPADYLPTALKNIFNHLDEQGKMGVLVPIQDFPFFIIGNVARSEKWQSYFTRYKEAQTFYPSEHYKELLANIGFINIKVAPIKSTHELTDDEFIKFTEQWCGYYSHLTKESLREEFKKDILTLLAKEKHVNGKFIMNQDTLRIDAEKPMFIPRPKL